MNRESWKKRTYIVYKNSTKISNNIYDAKNEATRAQHGEEWPLIIPAYGPASLTMMSDWI